MYVKDKIKSELKELHVDAENLLDLLANKNKKKNASFHVDYQIWYTKALKAVELLASDRYLEFRNYYDPNPKRKSVDYETYVINDYIKGVGPLKHHYPNFDHRMQTTNNVLNQLIILKSVSSRIDSILADLEASLYTELTDAELKTARKLVKISVRAAG